MPKSLRLGSDLEAALDRYCKYNGKTTSAVIREGVARYIERRRAPRVPSTWELGKDLFGADRTASRSRNISGRVKRLLAARLSAKHHR
jgi:hypothetical protein